MSFAAEVARRSWLGPGAGLAALALYARTLAPGLTWAHHGADGGDLLAAALTGGVPHPTGYPTYQILLRAAIALFPGEPARAGNWLSAACAACAVGLLADLAQRALTDGRSQQGWPVVCALAAALSWAASPLLWSQAVITEVYALHALAVVLVLWLLWRWREVAVAGRPAHRWLAATGLVFGLGLGNHLSLVLLLPAAMAWLWGHRHLWMNTPAGAEASAALALGLSVYLYLPLAAAGGGPVNWGDPRTPAGFWWVISGRAYADLFLGLSPLAILARISAWGHMALGQLGGGPWGLLLALAGLWWIDRRRHVWWRTTGLVALTYAIYSLAYRTVDSYVYLLPVWAMAALWLAAGLAWLGEQVANLAKAHGQRLAWLVAVVALVLLPGAAVLRSRHANDLSGDHEARDFVASMLAEAEPGAVILVATDRPTFALWYARYGLGQRTDVTPLNIHLYDFQWYRTSLRRHHPELMMAADVSSVAPDLERLIQDIAVQRPLYRAEPLDLELPALREAPAGALVRLWPEGETTDASE